MPARFILIMLNIFLVLPSLMFLGDLTDGLDDYRPYTETFQGFRTNSKKQNMPKANFSTRPHSSSNKKEYERYLIIDTEEGSEWLVGEDQQEYWKMLANEKNVGKKIRFYNRGDEYLYENPVRVELEDQVVFDTTRTPWWKYLVMGFTLVLTIYNFRSGKKDKQK